MGMVFPCQEVSGDFASCLGGSTVPSGGRNCLICNLPDYLPEMPLNCLLALREGEHLLGKCCCVPQGEDEQLPGKYCPLPHMEGEQWPGE